MSQRRYFYLSKMRLKRCEFKRLGCFEFLLLKLNLHEVKLTRQNLRAALTNGLIKCNIFLKTKRRVRETY